MLSILSALLWLARDDQTPLLSPPKWIRLRLALRLRIGASTLNYELVRDWLFSECLISSRYEVFHVDVIGLALCPAFLEILCGLRIIS